MNKLAKGSLAVVCDVVAMEGLRRLVYTEPQPRQDPGERSPYKEFPNRVLVVGGGFAGFTTAKTLGELIEDRDDLGVMVINKENFFTYWPMVAGQVEEWILSRLLQQL